MLNRLRFGRHIAGNHFARALACLDPEPTRWPAGAWFAAWRLGLYGTVADAPRPASGWRDRLAVAVSLAACGRLAEAEVWTRALRASHRDPADLVALAGALAPYLPALALSLLDGVAARSSLRAALLLRCGRGGDALALLEGPAPAGASPEWTLFQGIAMAEPPGEQLARFNQFLASHHLAPVALRDASRPPGANNLQPASALLPCGGPRVSVLMTAYQAAERIESAVHSVLGQTWRDIELIVVDDASSDATGAVLQRLAAADPRLRPLRLPHNAGTYVAKNLALQHASGEFVTCHDSDDWSHPQKIALQVKPLLTDSRRVYSTSCWVRIGDDGRCHAQAVHPLLRLNPSSPLFRRVPVQQRAGGWDPVRVGADSEFLARLGLVFGRRARVRVDKPLAFGAHRAGSLVTAPETGFGAGGLPPARLAYAETWGHRHIAALRAGRLPRLAADLNPEG